MGKGRKIRRITASYLERAALAYLERFASSETSLRRILQRRVDRAMRDDPECDGAAFGPVIDDLVKRFARAGLVDDRIYAEGKSRSLLRQGASLRRARMVLASKGIDPAIIESTVAALRDEQSGRDLDFEAALALAKRRRLGPFRVSRSRAEDESAQRSRDLAAMGRAGFSYDIAKRVIDSGADDV
jgi:regulatory protein